MKSQWSVRLAMVALFLILAASPSLATPKPMKLEVGPSAPQQNADSGRPIRPGTPNTAPNQITSDASLTTLFASNNAFAGNTFDLVSTIDITIVGWDVNLDNGGSTNTVDFYWRLGTAVGNENSAAGWNLMGTDNAVVSNGIDNPTPVFVGGLTMTAGQIYGIYFDLASYPSAAVLYTNGGPTVFSNADLSLTTNDGRGDPAFTGGQFFPRQWNGTVFYNYVITGSTLPTWAFALLMMLLFAAAYWVLRPSGKDELAA
jgi:hypothetical protein